MPIKSDPADWKDPRHKRGLEGEERAKSYLEQRGWEILQHRFRMGRFEVDIVGKRENVVTFFEVKTRWNGAFGSPLEAIPWTKRRDIARVAQAWIDRHGRPEYEYRFDVIGITLGARTSRIEHVEDAYRLT
jgi:putative endonuclease